MEGGDQTSVGNGGSRWNPTKEQISMLESLYRQGLRTPSAEQIQQITNRLREYGHIEGKNVFYWFQNHKARQRQKQKQEMNLAYFNRLMHSTSAFPPPHQNVICSPCCITPPRNDPLGLIYQQQQYPKVPLPSMGAFKRTKLIQESTITDTRYNKSMHDDQYSRRKNPHQETLDLFPIHPTGLLLESRNGNIENNNYDQNIAEQNKKKNPNFCSDQNIYYCSTSPSCSDEDQPFFDFFCGNNGN
ncbi:hypothetical protein CDL12_17144 [Handroanthus impetiginosus]|uniref:Homeobox domain-containing protein n=1 Tax=Handroanthus impetiginosus TaxID=429701 RepID=A0A2G9G139_9LAMI|nr:hypothetical protein CDL12_28488 [Handroanthus impetiginosus]PIN10261.1 hypothetical protein CDL12_17144 [Handroanthus impetiginosus]